MRIGFVRSLLFDRYGDFWTALTRGADGEVVFADRAQVESALRTPFVSSSPGLVFKVATAEATVLADCDMIVVPQLNPGSTARRGGAQDPWIAAFPELLGASGGLLNVQAVPANLEADVSALAIEFLQRLTPDPGRIRRLWDRNRTLATEPARPAPRQTRQGTTAVIGQPWLLDRKLAELAAGEGASVQTQLEIAPRVLRQELPATDSGLADTDREVLGAARWFMRRGGIARIVMVVDEGSGADEWLARQIVKSAHKPVEVVKAQDLLPGPALLEHLVARALPGAEPS